MPDFEFTELRQFKGRRNKALYEAVKAGSTADLPPEDQAMARTISEHMHLRHVHNALEFADLREGETYEIEVEGNVVSPIAHLVMHSAIKSQVEADPQVRAAFEKLVASGSSAHQAEHVLASCSPGCTLRCPNRRTPTRRWKRPAPPTTGKSRKITRDAAYRKKLVRQFNDKHFGFD